MTTNWKRYFIVRHGQSKNTYRWLQNKYGGTSLPMLKPEDDELSGNGIEQVYSTVNTILLNLKRPPKQYYNVEIVSSPSVRCKQTANIISSFLKQHGIVVTKYSEEQSLRELCKSEYIPQESKLQESDAINNWINTTFQDPADLNTVRIVVTHGNVSRKAFQKVFGFAENVKFGPAIANLSIIEKNSEQTKPRFVIQSLGIHPQVECFTWNPDDLFN